MGSVGMYFVFLTKRGKAVTASDVRLRLLDENAAYDCHPPKEETHSKWS